jgi:hypothetical protein
VKYGKKQMCFPCTCVTVKSPSNYNNIHMQLMLFDSNNHALQISK